MKRIIVTSIIIIFGLSQIIAQDTSKPIIAVTNIKPIDTSESMAFHTREILEAAFIGTQQYQVINYSNMKEILDVQAFSLSGCTDESCAVEIGKLLSAEQIVLGTLTSLDGALSLSVRVIDVQTGKNTAASIIKINSIDSMEDDIFVGAYQMTGLKYIKGSDFTISEKGSIYVTAPKGQEFTVKIDGKTYGQTPILVSDLSFGTHIIHAENDESVYENTFSITSTELVEMVADISKLTGNLFLKVTSKLNKELTILVNDQPQEQFLIRNLKIGEQKVVVWTAGWYFEDIVTINNNETTTLSVTLVPAGEISVNSEKEAKCTILDKEKNVVYEGAAPSKLPIATGSYVLSVRHPDFNEHTHEFTIEQNKEYSYSPILVHSESYEKAQQLSQYKEELARVKTVRKKRNRLGIMLLVASAIGFGATGFLEYLISDETKNMNSAYDDYLNATLSSSALTLWNDISEYKSNIESYRLYRDISLYSSSALLGTSLIPFIFKPSEKKINEKIEQLSSEEN